MAWPKGKPRPGAFQRKNEPPKPVAEIIKEETVVIPECAPNVTLNVGLISPSAAAEDPGVKIALDKPADSAVLLKQEEKMPQRVIADMINHRRMLKGMLQWVENYLRKCGVKIELT